MNVAKKERKFFALIIPEKYQEEMFALKPELEPLLNNISEFVAAFRAEKGKKPYPEYIICNQDEPYAEEVWKVILAGEDEKLDETTGNPDRIEQGDES